MFVYNIMQTDCIITVFSFCFFLFVQASRRLLKKARLVRSPKSPKQLPSVSKKPIPWQRNEQVALVQFVALFDDLKKDGCEWPTFGNRHDYWEKAAAFVQETTGTDYKRSSKFKGHCILKVITTVTFLLSCTI